MDLYWIYASSGLILLILEILLSAHFFLFFLGLAAFQTAFFGYYFDYSFNQYLGAFALLGFCNYLIWFFLFKKMNAVGLLSEDVNNPLYNLKGQRGKIVMFNDQYHQPKLMIKHTLWAVKCDNHELKKGMVVEVVGIEDSILIVKPVS